MLYRQMIQEIRQLLNRRDFQEAIRLLDELSVGESDLGPEFDICRTQALIGLGIYQHNFIDRAINALRVNGDNCLFADAKYFKARLQVIDGELTNALESLTEAYVCYKRMENCDGMAHATVLRARQASSPARSDEGQFRRPAAPQ